MSIKVKRNKFKSHMDYSDFSSASIFKIFSEYFNSILADNKKQETQEVKIIAMLREKTLTHFVRLEERYGDTFIFIEYKNIFIFFHFEVYKQNGETFFHLSVTSKDECYYDGEMFYKKMLNHAIENSELKGSMFSMERNELEWKRMDMQVRGFEDLFLPEYNLEELRLYIQTGIELDVFMRFLMVGNPGTGKTEATTVLSNILNKSGVTIIKTAVCDKIKEKVELASILAPTIIILDDIDLSLGSRNKGVYSERLQDFLDILDGAEKLKKNVGIIATTNSTALLDMAAQRPGRFDRVLLFNELTKENIKDIITKSLKDNFNIKSENNIFTTLITDNSVVDLLFNNGASGSYIYNITNMIKLKVDMLKLINKVNVSWVVKEIETNMQTMSKIKNMDFLSDKISNGKSNIGFGSNDDSEYEEDYCEEIDYPNDPPLEQLNEKVRRGR